MRHYETYLGGITMISVVLWTWIGLTLKAPAWFWVLLTLKAVVKLTIAAAKVLSSVNKND